MLCNNSFSEQEGIKMAHYSTQLEVRGATEPEWLRIGAAVGRLVNNWSFRSDLVAYVGDHTMSQAPAAFNPKSAEVEVDYTKCFPMVRPDQIGDLEDRLVQLEFAKGTGAIYHEACHAKFSRWSLEKASKDLSKIEFEACSLLEESRIERWGVVTEPKNRIFLQACAIDIVLADIKGQLSNLDTAWSASRLAGLTLARVDAGVLDAEDVEPMAEVLNEILGEDLIAELRKVWIEFQSHAEHDNPEKLYELAKKWVELVKEKADERGENPEGEAGEEQIIEVSEGSEGEGNSEGSEVNAKILKALKEIAENNDITSQGEANDQMLDEEQKRDLEEDSKNNEERKSNKSIARKIFDRTGAGSEEVVDTGKSNSRLIERRQPTADERASAVKLARQLEKARYRNRNVVEFNTPIPGGKLRSRAMVQQAALRSRGVSQQVDTWRHKKRKQTDKPDLKVAVMVDISGSMGAAMQPMATTAWVMSEAVRRVEGKVGMVYYGEGVFATLKPGQHLRDVQVYTASDNTERFGQAFQAVDGEMNLVNGVGARLIVVVSDGYYQYDERANAKQMLTKAVANGVGVLWIQIAGGYNSAESYLKDSGVKFVTIDGKASPSSVAEIIGKQAASALELAGKR
jgi:hypothetical protein